MITPIQTPNGRTDICVNLSEKHIRSLLKSGQPVFLLAEVGMEQEIIAVAEALAAQMTDGGTLDFFIAPNTGDLLTADSETQKALAGIPSDFFVSPVAETFPPANCSTKPLFFHNCNQLPPTVQNCLARCIPGKKIQYTHSDGLVTTYDTRPWLIFSATYCPLPLQISSGQLVNYLKGSMHSGVVDICLPGLIEVHPLRKNIDLVESYIMSYLSDLKSSKNTTDAPDGELCIEPEAIELLKTYLWPGNYDELRIILTRASIFASGGPVSAKDVEDALDGFHREEKAAEPILKYNNLPHKFDLDELMKSTEAHLIQQILKKVKTQKEASEILGFNSPQAFEQRIRRLEIELPAHLDRKHHKKNEEQKQQQPYLINL